MAELALLIDVGSTWTKGVAVSLPDGRLAWRCQHPTTLAEGIDAEVAAFGDRAPRVEHPDYRHNQR